jgi:polyhydroxybutyrate depolymerase
MKRRILLAAAGVALLLVLAVLVWLWWLPPGASRHSLLVDGQRRGYVLYVPGSYQPGTPTALVLSLHGFASWPAHQMAASRWNAVADEHGFIVAYPGGTRFPRRWVVTPMAGGPEAAQNDLAFIASLLDTLSQAYTIDPARVYASGLSNGAGMSDRLACEMPGRIAAIGTVAGAYFPAAEGCHPGRPVPVMAFHGTDDPIVPYAGGAEGTRSAGLQAVEAWAAGWAERNGCDPAPQPLPAVGAVRAVEYVGCRQQASVVLYTVEGGGHTWPGGGAIPAWIAGATTADVSASELMWAFFEQHPLPEN